MSDLRRLAEAAWTPGPWEWRHDTTVYGWPDEVVCDPVRKEDGPFIAACDPHTVLALLDERDRLREALEQIHSLNWQSAHYRDTVNDIAYEAAHQVRTGGPFVRRGGRDVSDLERIRARVDDRIKRHLTTRADEDILDLLAEVDRLREALSPDA